MIPVVVTKNKMNVKLMSNVMTKLDDIGDCSDTFDKVWSIDDGEEVGTITRHWPGFCKQVFSFFQ